MSSPLWAILCPSGCRFSRYRVKYRLPVMSTLIVLSTDVDGWNAIVYILAFGHLRNYNASPLPAPTLLYRGGCYAAPDVLTTRLMFQWGVAVFNPAICLLSLCVLPMEDIIQHKVRSSTRWYLRCLSRGVLYTYKSAISAELCRSFLSARLCDALDVFVRIASCYWCRPTQ